MRKRILNEEQTKVLLFMSMIDIDKELPKYRTIEELKNLQKDDEKEISNQNTFLSFPDSSTSLREISYDVLKDYFTEKFKGVADFNVTLSDTMRHNLNRISLSSREIIFDTNGRSRTDKESLFTVIKDFFRRKKGKKEEDKLDKKFDVIRFFSNVKLSTKEEAEKYKDRINEYISCIGYAEKSGQKALKEKLFEQLIINKYESILYANGNYKVLTEENLVKFAKGCPKALALDYISNYTRTIPLDVIMKKIELDKLEVFDNYVILHYDPEDNGTEKTNEEKAKEIAKKRDPILFGVIAGSNKLYYIADWEDDYCDLKFQDVVDALGSEIIEKDYLNEKIKM